MKGNCAAVLPDFDRPGRAGRDCKADVVIFIVEINGAAVGGAAAVKGNERPLNAVVAGPVFQGLAGAEIDTVTIVGKVDRCLSRVHSVCIRIIVGFARVVNSVTITVGKCVHCGSGVRTVPVAVNIIIGPVKADAHAVIFLDGQHFGIMHVCVELTGCRLQRYIRGHHKHGGSSNGGNSRNHREGDQDLDKGKRGVVFRR